MEKTKYNRAAKDQSQLQQFVDETIEALENVPTEEEVKETVATVNDGTIIKVIGVNADGELVKGEAGGTGLPEAEAEGRVLVGKTDGEWEQKKSVPLADNLLAAPITNDAPYSSGPTGGLADITTGEEAYLQEIKGMSIVWNQLMKEGGGTYQNDHIYVVLVNGVGSLVRNSSSSFSYDSTRKIFDLTLMFGGNEHIPFSLISETEYPANGTIPAQQIATQDAFIRFERLFANVDLVNAPYDAGTIKNVKTTKLVETGRNLWDASIMETSGLQLLAGYRYEIYINQTSLNRIIKRSLDGGSSWTDVLLTRYQRADGKYVWTFYSKDNCLIKSTSSGAPIVYVGFVHSGNYCLTTGTNTSASYAYTNETIPAYHKYEFSISGLSENGLNGLLDRNGNEICDTKDYRRIGVMDLANYQNVMTYDDDEAGWVILTADLPNDLDLTMFDNFHLITSGDTFTYLPDDTILGIVIYSNSSEQKPTDTILYPLTEPIATGEPAFEPIALKSGDEWIVDDMGSEYFIQPANTNCPVNQVSYYYENLKDKLQNMQEPIDVVAVSYDGTKEPLDALKIGNEVYKCIPQGTNSNTQNPYLKVAIGVTSNTNAGFSATAVGYYARARANYTTALGAYTTAGAQYAVTIGDYAETYVHNSVCFDGTTDTRRRSIELYSPEYFFFRFANISNNNTEYEDYYTGHYLGEYITNNHTLTSPANAGGKWFIWFGNSADYKSFTTIVDGDRIVDISVGFNGAHLVIKLSNNVVASLDLLPYDSDNSQAFTAYGIGDSLGHLISGYIDSDGAVVIDTSALTGVTISEVKYNLR